MTIAATIDASVKKLQLSPKGIVDFYYEMYPIYTCHLKQSRIVTDSPRQKTLNGLKELIRTLAFSSWLWRLPIGGHPPNIAILFEIHNQILFVLEIMKLLMFKFQLYLLSLKNKNKNTFSSYEHIAYHVHY